MALKNSFPFPYLLSIILSPNSENQFKYFLFITIVEMEWNFAWSLPVEMQVDLCFPLHFVLSHQIS